MDCYTGCGYRYADSANLHSWARTTTVPGGLSGFLRHGTVLRETGSAPLPITFYRITNHNSGKAVDVQNLNLNDGANVQQWACTGGTNQQWQLVNTSGGFFQLKARHSGKCLDVNGHATADGGNVQQWACTGGGRARSCTDRWAFLGTHVTHAVLTNH